MHVPSEAAALPLCNVTDKPGWIKVGSRKLSHLPPHPPPELLHEMPAISEPDLLVGRGRCV